MEDGQNTVTRIGEGAAVVEMLNSMLARADTLSHIVIIALDREGKIIKADTNPSLETMAVASAILQEDVANHIRLKKERVR